ncbi:MAG: TIGR01244 family sulfur transferase [Phenylobacterium sp.]
MSEFHRVTQRFSVAPQLAPEDMAAAAQQGFVRVVCNRPDSEGPGQPSGGAIKAAAQAAGLEFVHIPFAGMPDAATADAVFAAVSEAPGPVLASCRSGTRSVTAWALGSLRAGDHDREALVALAAGAGYDLSAVLPRPM